MSKKLSVDHFYQQFHNEDKHDQENESTIFSHSLAPDGHPIGLPLDLKTLRKAHARAAEHQLLNKADVAKEAVGKAALLATLRKMNP